MLGRIIKNLTICYFVLKVLTGCEIFNSPPDLSFEHGGKTYNDPNKNELEIKADEVFNLLVTAIDNRRVTRLYKENGGIVDLIDGDDSDEIFKGSFEGIAPPSGTDEFYLVAVDNCDLESTLPVTIKAIPHENQPPTLSFEYNGTTYNEDTIITAEAGETFTLENIIGLDDKLVTVYKRNGTDVALQDNDSSDERFEGEFSATAPLTGQEEYLFVAKDDEGLEKTVKVTIEAQDTTPPGNPANFRATPGIGEITVQWEEPSDTVGVTQYELKISPYNNIPDPSNPDDASDIADVPSLPSPVAPDNTLDKVINLVEPSPGGYHWSSYLRAGDAAGNWSDWVKVGDVLAERSVPPPVPPEPWGAVGESVADGEPVDVKDKYGNIIDKKISVDTPYGILEFGKTVDNYYICTVPDRTPKYGPDLLQNMITQIACYAVSRGAAFDLNDGSIRVDLDPIVSSMSARMSAKSFYSFSMPKPLEWFLEQTPQERQKLLHQ